MDALGRHAESGRTPTSDLTLTVGGRKGAISQAIRPAEVTIGMAGQDSVESAESMRSCSAETMESPVTT